MKKRLLWVCPFMRGMGHVKRSLLLCKELTHDFTVDLLNTGLPIQSADPNITLIQSQSTVLYNFNFSILSRFDPNCYDLIVTEHFPFGRQKKKDEYDYLITLIQKKRPDAPIICSYRGIYLDKHRLTEKQREKFRLHQCRVNERLEAYKTIITHCDPQVMRVEDSFYLSETNRDKVYYSGYVTDPVSFSDDVNRAKTILISIGTGELSMKILTILTELYARYRDYEWVFIKRGAYDFLSVLPSQLRHKIENNFRVVDFYERFTRVLADSSLIICNSGYGILDPIVAKTPAVVIPDPMCMDQFTLSEKLAPYGAIAILDPDTLNADTMARAIEAGLEKRLQAKKFGLNCQGTEETAAFFRSLSK